MKRRTKWVIVAQWKNDNNRLEVFSSLITFCKSYPRYDYATLRRQIFKRGGIENDELKIEKKLLRAAPKPDFPKCYFWEYNYDQIDWDKGYEIVIQRILERGFESAYEELVRFYGREKIIYALEQEILYFPDHVIGDICSFFKLEAHQLKCHSHKQSLPGTWI